MRKVLLTLVLTIVLLSSLIYSQTQKGINYQAVARNNDGTVMNNRLVGLRFSLVKGPSPGTNLYIETHSLNTNQFGLFSVVVGKGTAISGKFGNINWSDGDIYLKVEIDPAGGTSYAETGTTLLQAVPYALTSERATNDNDTDPQNEIQTLTINGNQLSISKGNAVTLPSSGGNQGDNWGNQTVATESTLEGDGTLAKPLKIAKQIANNGDVLQWDGNAWKPKNLSGDNWGNQYAITDATLTGKGTSGEPIKIAQQGATTGQVLSWTGSSWLPASNSDADADPANEIQTLTYSNDTLKLSNGGGNIKIQTGAKSIDDLTDGKTDTTSVFLGLNSGNSDDGINNNTVVGNKALYSNISGDKNSSLGSNSLYSNTSGSNNVSIGSYSLYSNITGSKNVAIGDMSMYINSSGNNNSTLGYKALYSNIMGNENVAFGFYTLWKNESGYSNVAIGSNALYNNTTKSNLVAIGDSALYNNGTGATTVEQASGNTAVGSKALYSNTTGRENTANGWQALYYNLTGYDNTANGFQALYSNTTGSFNTANGYQALLSNTTGSFNTANGIEALEYNISGTYNTATGHAALLSNITGSFNTANGIQSLLSNSTGSYNTAIGETSLRSNETGSYNAATGSMALRYNETGSYNTANGFCTLIENVTGSYNTAYGHAALYSNTRGWSNVAVGTHALYKNGIRGNLVAIGDSALYNNGSGTQTGDQAISNTAVGSKALFTNSIGSWNTATGSWAMKSNTTGNYNSSFGVSALQSNSTGSSNAAIGLQALNSNTTGSSNTALGTRAGYNQTTGSNNIYIDNEGTAGESNVIKIGDSQTACYIAGIMQTTTNVAANVYVDILGGTNRLMRSTSSARYKTDIRNMEVKTDKIYDLRPVTYKSKTDGRTYFGLIAEEVAKVIPELAEYARAKDVIPGSTSEELIPDAVQYPMLSVLLLNELKKQKQEIEDLKARLDKLEKLLNDNLGEQK